jgi:hypothetical protein
MADDDALVQELSAEIRAYLDAHPEAADTLDGIVQWWIVHQRFLRGVQAAGRALDELVAQGVLEKIRTADGRDIFRARRTPDDGGTP